MKKNVKKNRAIKKLAPRLTQPTAKRYKVAGLTMTGTEQPSNLLQQFLNADRDFVTARQADSSPGTTPEQLRSTLHAELTARSAGELVEKAMQSQQVSLRELAERLGVVNSRVAEIRKSGQAIEVQTLARYAQALGYDLEIAFVAKSGERLVTR